METAPDSAPDVLGDTALALQVAKGNLAAFETVMRQCNRKLFRIARGVLRDDAEAEESLQEAYLIAYTQISTFRGEARLSTWLSRIVINEALGRLRKRRRHRVVIPFAQEDQKIEHDYDEKERALADESMASPDRETLRAELRGILERKIDDLPVAFRTVFIMREVEEMTVEETAQCLSIPDATVRSRLFRAKGLLRESLAREMDFATLDVFGFAGKRCDRIVASVLSTLKKVST